MLSGGMQHGEANGRIVRVGALSSHMTQLYLQPKLLETDFGKKALVPFLNKQHYLNVEALITRHLP